MILAIGLASDSSPTEKALQDPNLKERFFSSAEALLQPSDTLIVSENFNGVPWTLQALVLMSFYMLCVSRQRTAHSYCGKSHILCVYKEVRLITPQLELLKWLSHSGFI
jgi:hypothetical protein